MDRGDTTAEVHNGLPSPYPRELSVEHQQTAVHGYSQAEQQRQNNYVLAATPTSDHSGHPASARSGSFPHHPYRSLAVGSMASHNPSMTAQQSPTQYAAYSQQMYHGEQHNPHYSQQAVYAQPRPDWTGYGQHTPITPNHHGVFQQQTTPTGHRPQGNQVFSFVPIPGSQQHKRPRRRYEEIERMYKCGWHGCEKAYGTLNHLNAHVTMQSHGAKRVPEEFKEIRKEWKAKKKAEEQSRKQMEEQSRVDGQTATPTESQTGHEAQQSYTTASRNLPPLSYNPNAFPTAPQYSNSAAGEYSSNYITANQGYPTSPYVPSHQAVYGTANGHNS